MRTKTLLLSAVAGALSLAAAHAQTVYSVNVVGYMNVTLTPGFNLIANQLNTTNNTIASLLPSVPPGFQVFKYTPGAGFASSTFDEFDLAWLPSPQTTMNPGEGVFLFNNQATNVTVTFVGEVITGNSTNSLQTGFQIVSSKLPEAGTASQLTVPGVPGDQIFKYTPGSGYVSATFDEFDLAWLPAEPSFTVGEAFFIYKTAPAQWVKSFNVNQ
jgi:hypothetical protein